MPDSHKTEPVPDELVKLGYDNRDVHLRPVVKALVALGIFLVSAQIVTYVVFVVMRPPMQARQGALVPASLPPKPLLQVHPKTDLRTLRQAESARLHSYGIDPVTGARHIPIERAMELVAAEGVPGGVSSLSRADVAAKPLADAPGAAPFVPERRPAASAAGGMR